MGSGCGRARCFSTRSWIIPEAALEEGEEEATLERAAAALDAVDYADAEETLVEEEESAWRKKLEGLKAFIAEYAETYGISDGNELGKK
jgi:hypothetical protein